MGYLKLEHHVYSITIQTALDGKYLVEESGTDDNCNV